MSYQIHHARGNLTVRQQRANAAHIVCYVEQHLNATTVPGVNYSMVIVDANSCQQSRDWGESYLERVCKEFGTRNQGVLAYLGRGSYNVRLVNAPAILVEPGFVSNPEFAARVRTGEGIDALARCLANSIREFFPFDGTIGLSAGHAYRDKPDSGAPVAEKDGLHDPAFDDEMELNIAIIDTTAEMLEG